MVGLVGFTFHAAVSEPEDVPVVAVWRGRGGFLGAL